MLTMGGRGTPRAPTTTCRADGWGGMGRGLCCRVEDNTRTTPEGLLALPLPACWSRSASLAQRGPHPSSPKDHISAVAVSVGIPGRKLQHLECAVGKKDGEVPGNIPKGSPPYTPPFTGSSQSWKMLLETTLPK
jgi:hypothetical protein